MSDIPKKMEDAIKSMMQDNFDHFATSLELSAYTAYDWGGVDDKGTPHVMISISTPWSASIGGASLEKLLLAECADRSELADLLEDLAAKIRNPIIWKRNLKPKSEEDEK